MLYRRVLAGVACALAASQPVPATAKAPIRQASTTTFQISKARIDRALLQMVGSGRAAGVSTLIWRNGREVYFGTAGYADREAKRPMRRDTLAQIWSMTKPVTGVAMMQLWEQGKFGLDDPLSNYLPEFADVKVFAGEDSSGQPILRSPARPIQVRDILRHTAGFSYGFGDTYPDKMFAAANPLDWDNDLPTLGRKIAAVPLAYDPGTQWAYSAAVDVQALLVEKLTGMPFESYVRQHILDPLKMRETGWTQPEERYPRLAATYEKDANGKLQRQTDEVIRRANFAPRKLTMGGAGLVSTLDDYMRFARMLLNRGSLDGVRVLKPSTIRLMSTDQLDPRVTERQWLPGKGNGGFGVDVFVRTGRPKSAQENRGAVGEFFWDGAASTLFWVDPANDLAAVLFVQTMPFDGTLHHDFRQAVYGASYLGPAAD